MSNLRSFLAGAAVCALISASACNLHAATILKLDLGNIGPDLQMTGGFLGTVSDSIPGTTGDQNTSIEYTGFLDPIPDVNTPIASFTLTGLSRSGDAVVSGSLVLQDFSGGTLELYDAFNTLLLSGTLAASNLQGTIGPPGTGAVLTTNFATVTGGVLFDFIVPGSLTVSMGLTGVNGGNGLSVTGNTLNPFQAESVVNIDALPTPTGANFPEPGSFLLAAMALSAGTAVRRRTC